MNKEKYMFELEKELKKRDIPDIQEILSEYFEHFDYKLSDGYNEEEISAKLGKPSLIAEEFDIDNSEESKKMSPKKIVGLSFLGIFSIVFFILLFSWVLVLGALTLALSVSGFCLISTLNINNLIPYMPYLGSFLLGLSLLALSVLSAIGTIYCFLFFKKLTMRYINWNINTSLVNKKHHIPIVRTLTNKRLTRKLRETTGLFLIIFALTFLTGFIVLSLYAKSIGFWHHFNWFV
jgi:uncharacterized membrane protein